jgi:hypothetical protein
MTTVAHGIVTNTWVVVNGVLGVPTANVAALATSVDTTHIDMQGVAFTGTYVSGGTISTQTNAAQLSTTWTRVTSGSTGAGVRLPTGTTGGGGTANKIKNATGNDGLVVWGNTGAAINANAVNRPVTVPNDWTGEFWQSSLTQWDTQP